MFATMRYARYAAYCACACLMWRYIDRKCTKCMEKPDDWNIEEECGKDEIAAGYLRKKGKGADIWSKRYMVIKNGKMVYYVDQMRDNFKGEVVIAGATASASGSRPDEEKKFYFEISHPACGIREFYVKSDMRRRQWVNKINKCASEMASVSKFGSLNKKGGMITEVWQKRWCCVNDHSLDYFDQASDSKAKGSIDIRAALVRNSSHDLYPYCFEIEQRGNVKGTARFGGGVKMKKGKTYVFAADNVNERDDWVNTLKSNAGRFNEDHFGADGEVVGNPLNGEEKGEGGGGGDNWLEGLGLGDLGGAVGIDGISVGRGGGRGTSRCPELSKEGHLEKKASTIFSSQEWQRRFFKLDKVKKALVYWDEQDGGTDEKVRNGAGGAGAGGPLVLSEKNAKPKNSALARLAATLDEGEDGEEGGGAAKNKANDKDKEGASSDPFSLSPSRGSTDDHKGDKDKMDGIPEKGSIAIAAIRGTVVREGVVGFSFGVKNGRVYHLRTISSEDRDEWVEALEAWIEFYS